MWALSVRGYWAWAIAEGHRRLENRSHFVNYRGPLAIHISMSTAVDHDSREFLRALGIETPDQLPHGAIVAVVDLVDVVPVSRVREDPFAEGPYCWILQDARKLATPVACPGRLDIFEVPVEVAAQVAAQLS